MKTFLLNMENVNFSPGCPFCRPQENRVLFKNDLAYLVFDLFPVTHLHALVIPFRHAKDYLELTTKELLACDELLRSAHEVLSAQDGCIKGFNIGVNAGSAAGQTSLPS